ncbi:GTP cyclohydrolase I [Vibrio phage nt-1]|uniref:GTP cyclohydrolase I n=1 Tax=Vibrio phage nt-1 TaxID=115992 RepID=R9TJA5_9CAUD|nr:GTP cyclohydrolase [Vibrio phage nt-1]AGN30172.1 GTP cyclohydrolase I [Vibrio phage nt-1]
MAFNKEKCDAELGRKIEEHLREIGMNTPMREDNGITDDVKIQYIESSFTDIMNVLGLDLSDDSLVDTPRRVAKMLVKETMWGLKPENFPKCTAIDNKMNYDEIVCETGITVMSQCEHHFVTIDGKATVAYIPNKKVLGLSKMNRIVEYFSRRPQVQERLTIQIAEALKLILETDNVAVVLDCEHYCVKSRGVEDHTSSTVTSSLSGVFRTKPEARAEFMALARK